MTGAAPAPGGILAGVRVWDASWVGVGPLTAKYLADYGATVVHTETAARPDVLRNGPPFRDGVPGIDRSQFFADFNASKYGLGLDLKHPRGRGVALALAGWADVVLESFSPGVMAQFGLGYGALAEVNPSLVMLSTSMNGQTGPRRKFAGFGTVMAAMAGFCEITGWPDRPPGSPYGAYTDFVSPRFAATALLAALDHRRRTGQGQYIDLAQYEASVQLHAPWLLDFEVNGQLVSRDGASLPTSSGLMLTPHAALSEAPKQIDTLIVAGGQGALVGKIWRMAQFGAITERDLRSGLDALEIELAR